MTPRAAPTGASPKAARARATAGLRATPERAPAAGRAGQSEADVAGHRQGGEQRPLLRDVARPPVFGGNAVPAVVDDPAPDRDGPGLGGQETGENPEEGGLPATGRAEHAGNVA